MIRQNVRPTSWMQDDAVLPSCVILWWTRWSDALHEPSESAESRKVFIPPPAGTVAWEVAELCMRCGEPRTPGFRSCDSCRAFYRRRSRARPGSAEYDIGEKLNLAEEEVLDQ